MQELIEKIEYVEKARCWTLSKDTWISAHVKAAGRLDWEQRYRGLSCWEKLKPGDVCLDIGAYIGDSIPPMLARGCEVVAVECQDDAFLCLTRNFPDIEWHLAICGDGERVGLPDEPSNGNLGGRSVIPNGILFTVRVDEIVKGRPIALAKIDVEGYECQVLRGMKDTIARCRPIVIIERNERALAVHGGSFKQMREFLPGYRWEEWQHTEPELWDYLAWP